MRALFRIFLWLVLLAIGCRNKNTVAQKEEVPSANEEQKKSISFTTFIADSLTNSWGYDIYVNGKKYIHQPIIPGMSGNRAFNTEGDARKTAELVVQKMKRNLMPPSVYEYELDSLGVLNKP